MNNVFSLVRELKGAPLSILVLLSASALPVSQEWLERMSGYTDKPVSQALAYLKETQRIARTQAGWQLMDGCQLLLGESRNISESVLVLNPSVIDNSGEPLNNNNKSRNISDSSWQDEIWKELALASVKKNDRTEAMAQLPHITPEYVKQKRLEFKAKNMGGYQWAGLFIKALENNDPVEAVDPEQVERKGNAWSEYFEHDADDEAERQAEIAAKQAAVMARREEIKQALRDSGLSISDKNRLSRELESLR